MGVFHTACTLLSIFGKRFQDAGLRDFCVESGAIVEGSAFREFRLWNGFDSDAELFILQFLQFRFSVFFLQAVLVQTELSSAN